MPRLPLGPGEFERKRRAYSPASERAIRDLQAESGEPATCPASNIFFKRALEGRRFRRAIDLGCHAGIFATEVLAPVSGRLVLVDFSAKALQAAKARLPRADALRADLAKELPLRGRFDLVALCEVIQHMPDPVAREAAFQAAAGLLEPDGILLFSTYFLAPGEPAEGFFRSDRHPHLLFYHRSAEAENARRFAGAGLKALDRMREARVDAFVLTNSP